MPTDAASPCWSENSCAEHHALQLQREAWPISAHAHWHSTHDYAPRVLHFSAFHFFWCLKGTCHILAVPKLHKIYELPNLILLKTVSETLMRDNRLHQFFCAAANQTQMYVALEHRSSLFSVYEIKVVRECGLFHSHDIIYSKWIKT